MYIVTEIETFGSGNISEHNYVAKDRAIAVKYANDCLQKYEKRLLQGGWEKIDIEKDGSFKTGDSKRCMVGDTGLEMVVEEALVVESVEISDGSKKWRVSNNWSE